MRRVASPAGSRAEPSRPCGGNAPAFSAGCSSVKGGENARMGGTGAREGAGPHVHCGGAGSGPEGDVESLEVRSRVATRPDFCLHRPLAAVHGEVGRLPRMKLAETVGRPGKGGHTGGALSPRHTCEAPGAGLRPGREELGSLLSLKDLNKQPRTVGPELCPLVAGLELLFRDWGGFPGWRKPDCLG